MELITYLNEHFLTKKRLLQLTKISDTQLINYQQQGVMPKCSYRINLQTSCDSFFGVNEESNIIEYYAKGYVTWLNDIQSIEDNERVYALFAQRYKQALLNLNAQGYSSEVTHLDDNLASHIKVEWLHFLKGTYGLCTRSGLPEDIAKKELAIAKITLLINKESLCEKERLVLNSAVDLLDEVSALFAPHERMKSTRYRFVDKIKAKYQL